MVLRRPVFPVAFALIFLAVACSGGTPKPAIEFDGSSRIDGDEGDARVSPDVILDTLSADDAAPGDISVDAVPDIPVDTPKDSGADVAPDVVQDLLQPDVCVPACAGECGDDGCGGSCGECGEGEECLDGECIGPQPCQSSKDCDGDLVCDIESGECVDCVDNPDCPDGFKCNAEHECVEIYLCDSDKDCSAVNMVCDKEAGECVDCLGDFDCSAEEYCLDKTCVDDICDQELTDPVCVEDQTMLCTENGSEWVLVQECGAEEFCDSGQCLPWLCVPDETGCADDTLSTCNNDGSGYTSEIDCLDGGKICFGAECLEVVCNLDDYPQCADPMAVLHCTAKGSAMTEVPCGPGQFCNDDSGNCEAWVCEPDSSSCDGQVALTCNDWGSGWSGEIDCELDGLFCYLGGCEDQVCAPNEIWCLTDDSVAQCDDTGMAFDSTPCGQQQSCWDSQCHDWECAPGQPMCAGKIATLCNLLGSGPKPGGESCDGANEVCQDGECVCVPDSCADLGVECGNWDDGCGGDVHCPVCTGNDVCQDGACVCILSCEGKECGGDGCGGSCGGCPGANNKCQGGTCVCVPDTCGTLGKECDSWSDGCGGQAVCGVCAGGQACQDGQCQCVPDCAGKECGGNGCGGSCGSCSSNEACQGGDCVPVSGIPGCTVSGQSGCGGCPCEACVCQMDPYCCQNQWDTICVSECMQDCGGCVIPSCGNGSCQPNKAETCSSCPADCGCPGGEVCHNSSCCAPDCSGKECGGDGCGGNCGGCPGVQVCVDNSCCTPDCEGKECGDDGCGGNCGWCGWWGSNCWQGTCYSQPGCVTSNNKGCNDCACEDCVCDMDAFCCNNHWDAQCVNECFEDCGGCI